MHLISKWVKSLADRWLSVLDCSFVDKHYRNIVPNRINAFAFDALQAAAVGLQFNFCPTHGTNQNLEQLFTYGHHRNLD